MLKLVKGQSRITKFSLNHVPILNLSRRNTSMWAGSEWGWCWCTTTTTSTATTATSNTTTTSSTSTATSTTIHSGKWGRARTRHWSCFGKLLVLALLKLPLLGSNCAYLITNYDLLQCKGTIIWICIKNFSFVILPNTPGQAGGGALLWSAAGWSSRANWSVIRSQAILHHILMRGSKAQRKAHPEQRLIFNQHEKWKEKETKKGLGCTWWISDRLTILLANAKSF